MRYILIILLFCCASAYGQTPNSNFGYMGSNPAGTSTTFGILIAPKAKFASTVAGDSSNRVIVQSASTGELKYWNVADLLMLKSDSDIYVTQYQLDTSELAVRNEIGNTQYYGTIYNANSWASLSGFTQNGCTASVVSSDINFSGGANNNSQSLDYDYYSGLEHFKITGRFIITEKSATSYGFGVGVRSYTANNPVSLNLKFDMSTGGNSGKILLYTGTNTTLRATSATALTFSVGDSIVLSVERFHNKLVGWAYNTTNGTSTSVTFTFPTNPPVYAPNRWKYSVYSVGGTFTLDSLNITSKELKYASWGIGGDSKVAGYRASDYSKSFYSLLKESFADIFVSASGSDMTEDLLAKVPEIIALKPKQFIIAIGCNDLRFGVDTAVMKDNIDSIAAQVGRAGSEIFYLTPFPESSLDQTVLLNFIRSKPSTHVIDVWDVLYRCNGACRVDAFHLNDSGMIVVYDKIMAFSKLKGANNILDYAIQQKEPVYPIVYTNLYPSQNTLTLDTANWHSTGYYDLRYSTPDSTIWQTKYRSDTARDNMYAAIAAKFTLPALTSGSVVFSDGTTLAQDNSSFFYDNTNDRLGIGLSAPATKLHVSTNVTTPSGTGILQVTGNTGNAQVTIDAFAGAPLLVGRRANGTNASKTATVLNDVIMSMGANGYTGSAYTSLRAGVSLVASENHGASNQGMRIDFNTAANAGGALTTKMRLQDNGNLIVKLTPTDDGSGRSIQTTRLGATDTIRTNTVMQEAGITSAILKTDANGVHAAAVAGTDYVPPSTAVNGQGLSGSITISGDDVPNDDAITSAGTYNVPATNGTLYISFTGTTSTWTLPTLASSNHGSYFVKNRGSGDITVNSNAGGNDIYNTSAVNTFTIAAGMAYLIHNDGTFFNIE